MSITVTVINYIIRMASSISASLQAKVDIHRLIIDREKRIIMTVLKRALHEIRELELLIDEKKLAIYTAVSRLETRKGMQASELQSLRRQIAVLAEKLLQLENIERRFDRQREKLESHKALRRSMRKWLAEELAKIDKYEHRVELDVRHIEKIIRDARKHIAEAKDAKKLARQR